MKKETSGDVIIKKLLILVVTVIAVVWFALGIYNPWDTPTDCDYEQYGCQGDNSKFGQ